MSTKLILVVEEDLSEEQVLNIMIRTDEVLEANNVTLIERDWKRGK